MRDNFEVVIDNAEWDAFVARAKAMPAEVGQKAINKVINKGLDDIIHTMSFFINSESKDSTGNLVKMLSKKRKKTWEPSFWHGAVAVKVGKTRKDGAFYWHFVEYGHRIVTPKKKDTGRKVSAMKFAESAYNMNAPRILSNFSINIRAELERLWKKASKKGG